MDRAIGIRYDATTDCVYVAGSHTVDVPGSHAPAVVFAVLKLNRATGAIIAWTTWPPSPAGGSQYIPTAMEIGYPSYFGGQTTVFITGSQPGQSNQCDYATIAIAGDLSQVYWNERYNHDSFLWQVGSESLTAFIGPVLKLGCGSLALPELRTEGMSGTSTSIRLCRRHWLIDKIPTSRHFSATSPDQFLGVYLVGDLLVSGKKNMKLAFEGPN